MLGSSSLAAHLILSRSSMQEASMQEASMHRVARRLRVSLFAALVVVGFAGSSAGAEDLPSFLDSYRGQRLIIDVPDYAGFEKQLSVPSGWKVLRADDQTVDKLLAFLGARTTPAVGYLDVHGNVIYVDESERSRARKRVREALQEFAHRSRRLRKELADRTRAAASARSKSKASREVEHLLEIRSLGVRGYDEVARAEARLLEIERNRTRRLYAILAREGVDRRKEVIAELESLLEISERLRAALWIRRHLDLLRQNITVGGEERG